MLYCRFIKSYVKMKQVFYHFNMNGWNAIQLFFVSDN